MCGIAGAFGSSALGANPELGRRLAPVLAHRGPDRFGCWSEEPDVSLLHWRLSILDLSSAGDQPMQSSDGRFVLCYNGEVYNHRELRADVERAWREAPPVTSRVDGDERRWRGHSDTEVIAEGCALWGVAFLERLNGMFALALLDRRERRLHLARDRAGIKPLYVYQRPGLLLFASEAKLFFHVPEFVPGVEPRGLAGFFTYGHSWDDCHVLRDVRQLEPGELLSCARSAPGAGPETRSSRLCPRPSWRPVRRRDADAATELRSLLARVVERQLVADVPVGVLLSGGVDSSILTALAARILGPRSTVTFTLGYPGLGADFDELDHARRVARHLGVEHHVYEARSDDLIHDLERLVWHYDEPFADAAALNVFLLSRLIRSRVTVALAGEGSDELFGGYRRYQLERALRLTGALGRAASGLVRRSGLDRLEGLPRRAQIFLRALAEPDGAARYSSFLQSGVSPDALLKPEWRTETPVHPRIEESCRDGGPRGIVSRLCLADQQFWLPSTYLEKSDKGSMAHSLELRVPYLDDEVVEFANSLPDSQRIRGRARKWLLRRAFGDLLPPEVFRRFKRGFGVPVARWLRGELREYFAAQVLSPTSRVNQYLQAQAVEACFREHLAGQRDRSIVLWQCLVLEIWLRHLERRFETPTSEAPRERVVA